MVDRRKRSAIEASLDEWYSEDDQRSRVLEEVVSGKAGFSLRTLDFFVTNYAARKPVVYVLPETGKVVDVNSDYKDVLRCFHKCSFDSFKRKGSDPSEAALRQKNFFRWAIENGVVDYVARNARTIERDMAKSRKKQRVATTPSKSSEVFIKVTDAVMDIPDFANSTIW